MSGLLPSFGNDGDVPPPNFADEEINKRVLKLTAASSSKNWWHMIGKAIAIYEVVVRETGLNGKIIVRHEDGSEDEMEVR